MEQARRRWRIRGIASAATVAAGVALAGPGFAVGANSPPAGQISAINNADEVRVLEQKAAADPQVQRAEAKAKTARAKARHAVSAATKAKKKAARSAARAKRLRTAAAARSAAAAKAAARKANARARSAKRAAARATAHAEAVRRSVTRASHQRTFTADSASGATTTDDRRRSLVLDLANQARTAAGCRPLTYHSLLERAAQGHADDMARYRYMGHVSKDGRTFDQRIRAAGFDGDRIGENVGAGFSTADAVVDAWMHSPAHRANILDCRYHYLGVGYTVPGGYWVQNFGS